MIIQQNFSIRTVASLNKHWCVILGGEGVHNDFSAQLEYKQEQMRSRNVPQDNQTPKSQGNVNFQTSLAIFKLWT